jgi:biotin carboxyl carrier protein
MPERDDPSAERRDGLDPRSPAERLADHAAIGRLAIEVLPSLVARLSGTGLGELEVWEGDWRVRLRRPAGERRAVERSGRAVRPAQRDAGRVPGNPIHEVPTHGAASHDVASAARRTPLVATSPAVGIFRVRPEIRTGARVREGERVAIVDLLGVPQDVLAPGDAVVAALFAADGDAVEYGQALIALEPVGSVEHDLAPQAVPVG